MNTNYLSLDNLIVYVFLLLTLIIGLFSGRNIKSLKEYALGNKTLSTGIITITFLATYIEGNSIIGTPSNIFSHGIINSISLGTFISFFLGIIIIAPKISLFPNAITLGDIMGDIYNSITIKILIGAISSIFSIFMIAGQMWAIGYIGSNFLNLRFEYGVIIIGLIIVLYSSLGGIRSVAITDILQFISILILVSLITNKVSYESGGIKQIFEKVKLIAPEKLVIFNHPNFFKR